MSDVGNLGIEVNGMLQMILSFQNTLLSHPGPVETAGGRVSSLP